MPKRTFKEELFNHLYQVFQQSGVSFDIPRLEKLHVATDKLAECISKEATIQAIDLLVDVQKRVLTAVETLESKIEVLERRTAVDFQYPRGWVVDGEPGFGFYSAPPEPPEE